MDSVIEVRDLTRRYGELLAVDRIGFSVQAGEIFGFLGPNAAGKTTTQRMLTGALRPTSGSVQVLDHDMVHDPLGAKLHFGVVPEMANPYMEMSGWQNMLLAGELYGVPRADRHSRSQQLLHQFGLWDRRNDRARGYSKGMKQRLILAMALIHQPDILFLDEPTSGLDVTSSRQIRAMVTQFAADGGTVFYTTHNIEEANQLCNRVAIINQGQIAAIDAPEALKALFAESQSVVAAFADPVPWDQLQGLPQVDRLDKEGDKVKLYTTQPGLVAEQITNFAHQHHTHLLTINTMGPSLEEVFIRLTQHSASPAEDNNQ